MLPKSIQNLIDQFSKLPGIGPRMAARLTFYLLTKPSSEIQNLASALAAVTSGLVSCKTCGYISENETICPICLDEKRQDNVIVVVEEPLDVVAFERTNDFLGKYHVLGGVLSPINGVGPQHLRIQGLVERVKKILEGLEGGDGKEGIEKEGKEGRLEVIIATNPSLEGEATASYLTDQLSEFPIKISRIARGLPMGSEIEFADPVTLQRALEGRRSMK